MAVVPLRIVDNTQRSEWRREKTMSSHRSLSSTTIPTFGEQDDVSDSISFTALQPKRKRTVPACLIPLFTFIAGLLLTGIAAAVGFGLWATSTKLTTTMKEIALTSARTTSTTTSTTTSSTTTTIITTTSTAFMSTSMVPTAPILTTTSTMTTTTTTIENATIDILWKFDNDTNDIYNIYNAQGFNGPTYVKGYTGRNQSALAFNSSEFQYVSVVGNFLNLTYISFTVEMWFYPLLLTSGDFGLFGQCQSPTKDLCLIYMIRNYRMLMAFHTDDVSGTSRICVNHWYHAAFVYDYSRSVQSLYLNGRLENSRLSSPYQGMIGDIFIGAINNGKPYYFNGYIDHVSLVTRAKSAAEVLMDATLVCFYSFDLNEYEDSGPLSLTATGSGFTKLNGQGRINSAISFTNISTYFVTGGLTKLGTSGQAFSISIWIKPTSVNGGTLVHVSNCDNGCTPSWCLAFIGFTFNGAIAVQSWSGLYNNNLVSLTGPVLPINSWTHVAQTYSLTNGMRLFINGNLFNQSNVFTYLASNTPNYMYIGSYPFSQCVGTNTISTGQYYGLVDEFHLFSRDLTPAEVFQLANP